MRTSNIEHPTSNIEVKKAVLLSLRCSMLDVQCSMFVFALLSVIFLSMLTSCAPTPKPIDTSGINGGVQIIPEAVVAAQKITPSDVPTHADQQDIIDVISDSDQPHYTLIELLRDSGLVPLLQQDGPYTVLAPTDDAFRKLPPGVIDRLKQPDHHDQLVQFMKMHILPGEISEDNMLLTNGQIKTLANGKVIVKGVDSKVMVDDANILKSDSSAANGVVDWIDHVILPPA
jgi:uncharacterized surface protein with fasciclin (FAS1) repeats